MIKHITNSLPPLEYLLKEGAFIEFDENGNVVSTQLSTQVIEGEQLTYSPQLRTYRKTTTYSVAYSLKSNPSSDQPKKAQDVLKTGGKNISKQELKALVDSTFKDLGINIKKFTHVLLLGSSDNLVNLLGEAAASLAGAKLIHVPKMEYKYIDNAVNWEEYQRQTKKVKRSVDDYLDKRAKQSPGPYTISKTGLRGAMSKVFYTKYDVGVNPYEKGKVGDTVTGLLHRAVAGIDGVRLLIVDDNIHSGQDFSKLFDSIDEIYKGIEADYTKTVKQSGISASPVHRSHPDRIMGYVLYKLEDEDIIKTKEKQTGTVVAKPSQVKKQDLIDTVIKWYETHPEPTWRADLKIVQRVLKGIEAKAKTYAEFESEIKSRYGQTVFSDPEHKRTYKPLRK